jgi:non-specific serine/threonine protein kinase
VLHALGLVAFGQADYATARGALQEAVDLARDLDEPVKAGNAMIMLISTEIVAGNFDTARRLATEQVAIGQVTGDDYVAGMGLFQLGRIEIFEGSSDRARTLLEQARARFLACGVPHIGVTLQQLATLHFEQGDNATARTLAEEGFARAQKIRGWGPTQAAVTLAWVLIAQRDWSRALDVLTTALAQAWKLRDTLLVVQLLELLAAAAAGMGQSTRALRLNSAALAIREAWGVPRPTITQDRLERSLGAARRALTERGAAQAVAAGRALSLEQAVAEGLADVAVPPHTHTTSGEQSLLSPRERQVAVLLARGLSNPQIGEALVVSRGTVERHVANILAKLEYRSRAQVAAWAATHDLLTE